MKVINWVLAPLIALSIVFAPFSAYASRGTGFYYGADNIAEIRAAVIESLAEDPQGDQRLRPQDMGDVAYATPNDYLVMLRQRLESAGASPQLLARLATVADLPAYLDSLVESEPPEGEYWSACITSDGPVLRCELSPFGENEMAWVDPLMALAMFKKDCTNPIGGPGNPLCYVFTFDYREERAVRWLQGNIAAVSVHFESLTEEEFARVYADDCYFVQDADGRRKPVDNCPTLLCPPGSRWPQVALAEAVGIPGTPPEVSIHFGLRNGVGILSVPAWTVNGLGDVIPCVLAIPYAFTVRGYPGYRALTRHDVAQHEVIVRTRASGRYPHPFVGAMHY